jgi:hypothetical protein
MKGFCAGLILGLLVAVIVTAVFTAHPVNAQGYDTTQTIPKEWGSVKGIWEDKFIVFEDSAGNVRLYDLFAKRVWINMSRN